jgi:hypothetical protein
MQSGTQLSARVGRAPSDATTERSIAILCRNLAHEVSPLLSIGRFELVRTVGHGGNGIVYEALDRARAERIALKILHERGPTYLYRLKREFRSLARIRHPSLIALHELFVEADDAYFTMELIDGCDFLSFVHRAASEGADGVLRVRDALSQLCEGIGALHESGVLHRDLKPSNVLVTEAERVVVLDFGLAGNLGQRPLGRAGTPGYMAPEQARGLASESSDWFSFGRMLERTLDVLDAHTTVRMPARSGRDWRSLSVRLLDQDPSSRPAYPEILAALGGARSRASSPFAAPAETPARSAAHSELATLVRAFERSLSEPLLVVVRGESRSGKSGLLRDFAAALDMEQQRPALILRGRCHERESLPYKGLDSVIDEVSRVLIGLPIEHAARAPLPDVAALLAVFPVLGRVPWLAAERSAVTGLHPIEARERGFAALRALLARLATDRALVVCIDDMQWSDADSGRLLGALLCEEDTPAMLVVVTDQPENCAAGSALDELHSVSELSPRPVGVEELELPAPAVHAGEAIALAAALERRVRELPASSRAIVEVASLAGRPLPTRLVARAAGVGIEHHAHVKALRARGLVRTVLRGNDEWLELEHEHVSMAVRSGIAERARLEVHRRLIDVLQGEPDTTSEILIEQYAGAGEQDAAARCARSAADAALSSLAFARAARLYERALALGRFDAAARAELHRQHATALAHAGRGIESAEAFRVAAAHTADRLEAASLEVRAADQLMRNGRYREGEASLRRVYRAFGRRWPETRLGVALGIAGLLLARAARPLWPRLGTVDPQLRGLRSDVISEACEGLGNYDTLRSIHNVLLCFDEAHGSDDARWQLRIKASAAVLRILSRSRDASSLRELEGICDAAAELDDAARGVIELQLALTLQVKGRASEALAVARRAELHLAAVPGATAALHRARTIIGAALMALGRLREARRHWHALTHAARLHGDLMTIAWVHTQPVQLAILLATQDRARLETILERAAALRASHPRYFLVGWAHAAFRLEHASYWGDPAEALEIWRAERAVLLGAPFWVLTNAAVLLRARAHLLAASAAPRGLRRAMLLRRAAWDAARLARQPSAYDRGAAKLLSAAVAVLRGAERSAIEQLDAAHALFEACEARLFCAAARYCKGSLLGGAEGAALQVAAIEALDAEGVVDPRRYIAWLACGFQAHVLGADR